VAYADADVYGDRVSGRHYRSGYVVYADAHLHDCADCYPITNGHPDR
jgi:hypothetical protein